VIAAIAKQSGHIEVLMVMVVLDIIPPYFLIVERRTYELLKAHPAARVKTDFTSPSMPKAIKVKLPTMSSAGKPKSISVSFIFTLWPGL